MPYSPSHHYVHVAIPKTGTTSLISALQELHARDGGSVELCHERITPEFRERHRLNEIDDPHPGRTKHLSATQLQYILGDECYDRCFKFSIVRNPFARLVSRYFFSHVDNEPSDDDRRVRGTTRKFHDLDFRSWLERRRKRGKERRRSHRSQLSA